MLSVWKTGTAAHRRYVIRTFAFMIPYMLVCLSMMVTDAFDEVIGKPAGWGLAAAVSAPVIGQLWATLSLMRESDEFVRAVTAKQFIVAAGVAMALATFWGFAETFANAPHLPGWLIYAAFWGVFGCVAPLHPGVKLMRNRLKLLRVERGWTQEQLGQALGVSRQAVNALETEKHDPSLDLAYRIAGLFARPVEEIFENPHG